MLKQEGNDPYNNNPLEEAGIQPSDTVDFDLTPAEAAEAEKLLYTTLDYDGRDKGDLNTNMSSLRREGEEGEQRKAA